jgi:hypothetical protein
VTQAFGRRRAPSHLCLALESHSRLEGLLRELVEVEAREPLQLPGWSRSTVPRLPWYRCAQGGWQSPRSSCTRRDRLSRCRPMSPVTSEGQRGLVRLRGSCPIGCRTVRRDGSVPRWDGLAESGEWRSSTRSLSTRRRKASSDAAGAPLPRRRSSTALDALRAVRRPNTSPGSLFNPLTAAQTMLSWPRFNKFLSSNDECVGLCKENSTAARVATGTPVPPSIEARAFAFATSSLRGCAKSF